MSYLMINNSFKEKFDIKTDIQFVNDFIENNKIENFILILPTSKLVKHYKSKIIKQYYQKFGTPISRLNIYSINQFIKYVFDLIFSKSEYKVISEAYSLVLFKEAFEKSNLRYFVKESASPGLLKRLFSIINGLREDGITSTTMEEDIANAEKDPELPYDIKKMNDTCELLKNYEVLLGNRFLDNIGVLKAILTYFKNTLVSNNELLNSIFKKIELIYLWGFTDFKNPELEFIELFENSNLPFALHLEYSVKDGPLLGGIETTIESLSRKGFRLFEIENDFRTSLATNFLKKNLFLDKSFEQKTNLFDDAAKIIACDSPIDEVRFIGKMIKVLNTDFHFPIHEICIAMRNPDKYSELFREVFYQYSIPTNITNRLYLNQSSIITSIFSFINLIKKGFRRQDLAAAFNNPFIDIEMLNPDNPIDIGNLISIANKYRIKGGAAFGGKHYWLFDLNRALNLTKNNIEQVSKSQDNEINSQELFAYQKEYEKLQKAIDDINTIFDHFTLNFQLSVSDFVLFIKKNIISDLKIIESIEKNYHSIALKFLDKTETENLLLFENLEKESRAVYSFLEVLDEISYVIRDRFGNEKKNFDYFYDLLKTAVDGKRYQLREKSNYGVNITSIEQTRGIPYKIMFLCGMVDNEFPLGYRPEIFLGKEIPETEERHNINERMLFYQFLSNSPEYYNTNEKKVYLLYPKSENNSQLLKSSFIDYLLNISYIKEIDINKNTEIEDEIIRKAITISASKIEFAANYEANQKIDNDTAANEIDEINSILDLNKHYSNQTEFIDELCAKSKDELVKYSDKIYSVTEFDEYTICPMKYFINRVLRVKSEEEKQDYFSSLELGNIIHAILFKFYNYLSAEDPSNKEYTLLEPIDKAPYIVQVILEQDKKEKYLDLLKKTASEYLSMLEFTNPMFKYEFDKIIGSENYKGILEIWLDAELKKLYSDNKNDGSDNMWQYHPALFEYNFATEGLDTKKPYITYPNGVKINGKIDRVEFYYSESKNQLQFLIADYKADAQKSGSDSQILKNEKLQIPLYLKGMEINLNSRYKAGDEMVFPAGGVYYSYQVNTDKKKDEIKYENKVLISPDSPLYEVGKKNKFITHEDIENAVNSALEYSNFITEKIAAGEFSFTEEKKKNCESCKKYNQIDSICRVSELFPASDNEESDDE